MCSDSPVTTGQRGEKREGRGERREERKEKREEGRRG